MIVIHVCKTFGHPICSGFRIVREDRIIGVFYEEFTLRVENSASLIRIRFGVGVGDEFVDNEEGSLEIERLRLKLRLRRGINRDDI